MSSRIASEPPDGSPVSFDPAAYFRDALESADPALYAMLGREHARQFEELELIASENFVSCAVLAAQGSVLGNKTVEGYPGARYHAGAHVVDDVERLALKRAQTLFDAAYANVQPHSGSQANQAVFKALLKPGGRVLSMDLRAGGHLSHGAKANLSGQIYAIESYGVDSISGRIDMDRVRATARKQRPDLIVAGASSYPRALDLPAFRSVADEVGARLLVDMAHFAGLVAGGVLPNPVHHADVVTTTTYKSLRGARGGLILSADAEFGRRFQSAIFPGVQGSVLLNMVAAKAVGLGEALDPSFSVYAAAVQANARALAGSLAGEGLKVVTDGTDTPIIVVDLRAVELTGASASALLGEACITCNKNLVPLNERPPQETSGLRFGVSALTTRGMGESEMRQIGTWVGNALRAADTPDQSRTIGSIRTAARELATSFPFYAPAT